MRALVSIALLMAISLPANARHATTAPLGCWQLGDREQVTIVAKGGGLVAIDRFASGRYQSDVTRHSSGKWEFDCRPPSIHGQFCIAAVTGADALEVVVYARSYRDQRHGTAVEHFVASRCTP